MSIKFSNKTGWIVCHPSFFDDSSNSGDNNKPLRLARNLFEISHPFKLLKIKAHRKYKQVNAGDLDARAKLVQSLYEKLLTDEVKTSMFTTKPASDRPHKNEEVNKEARDAANRFFETVRDITAFGNFYGENYTNLPIITPIDAVNSASGRTHSFVLPPRTKFYCYDVYSLPKKFLNERFDLIVLDPPWWNKYVRNRKRKQHEAGYELMPNNDVMLQLPIKTILCANGIIAVWCTNSPSHLKHLKNVLFPDWNIEYLATWYWLKITEHGEPVCPYEAPLKKQPFELIILGKHVDSNYDCDTNEKLIVSIPSSIHSHKPPLLQILRSHFSSLAFDNCCEFFARYLIPGVTSVGNEVIKLQHESLYEEVGE